MTTPEYAAVRIELVREHEGTWEDRGVTANGMRSILATPPYTERGPYPCGCTTCQGVFVLQRALCSGGCGCELTADGEVVVT